MLRNFLFLVLMSLAQALWAEEAKLTYQDPAFLYELADVDTFTIFSTAPGRTNMTQVASLKVTVDLRRGFVLYANAEFYPMHFPLAEDFLDFKQGLGVFNQTQYASHPDRYLLLAQLVHHKTSNTYTLFFDPVTEVSCDEISYVFHRVRETSFLRDKLVFHANKPERDACTGMPKITTADLYKDQTYQALNIGDTYGYLKLMQAKELDAQDITRRDLLVLEGLPNEAPVVAGLITSQFQTPLSHLNVLSIGRGSPNMALKNATNDPKLQSLDGKLVHLRVLPNEFAIREATPEQAQSFWQARDPQTDIHLQRDIKTQGLVELGNVDRRATNLIGAKAANFAELKKIGIPVTEDHFAIPFFYYDQHMRQHGLYKALNDMLVEAKFHVDPTYRRERLKAFRKLMRAVPLDPELNRMATERIDKFSRFPSYRFRSSTNAEDLEIFSGAGLYDSTSAKRDNPKKTVERAIKKVWASLWNWRAYEERDYYRIKHDQLAMGILVTRSFPDEDVNGVLITKNLYGSTPAHTINVAPKEFSVVLPEDGYLNDQILMRTWQLTEGADFNIEYLTRTDRPGFAGKPVMSNKELNELSALATRIKTHYFDVSKDTYKGTFADFGMELEFKLDSTREKRKLYIKQARPFRAQ